MAELTNEEINKARFKIMAARIEELENENKRYLDIITRHEKKEKTIIKLLYGDGSDGEILSKIMEIMN